MTSIQTQLTTLFDPKHNFYDFILNTYSNIVSSYSDVVPLNQDSFAQASTHNQDRTNSLINLQKTFTDVKIAQLSELK